MFAGSAAPVLHIEGNTMSTERDHIELGQFIPAHYHHNMLNDMSRMQGFRDALRAVVPLGGKVLELGGGTGVLSFFAAERADKVWCVERNPEMLREARRILALNPRRDRVEIVAGDAFEYLPPEPVDVVVCEMLHVGMLREKQIPVISAFKERYLKAFGAPLPRFVPEAFVQAVQPVQQDFEFLGYHAPTIQFQDPLAQHARTRALAEPAAFQLVAYDDVLPALCQCDDLFTVTETGEVNALRFITKNLLAILVEAQHSIDWFNQYLLVPLPRPIPVQGGEQLRVRFCYPPGASFDAVVQSLRVDKVANMPCGTPDVAAPPMALRRRAS
jgi:predicted RNA methylase